MIMTILFNFPRAKRFLELEEKKKKITGVGISNI